MMCFPSADFCPHCSHFSADFFCWTLRLARITLIPGHHELEHADQSRQVLGVFYGFREILGVKIVKYLP